MMYCRMLHMLSLLCLVTMVTSSCHTVVRALLDGDDDDHCTHPEFPEFHLKVDTFITTKDCLNISCYDTGVHVCQFGWALAGVVGVPDDCTKVKVGDCGVRLVKADDEETLCFPDESIEYNSI